MSDSSVCWLCGPLLHRHEAATDNPNSPATCTAANAQLLSVAMNHFGWMFKLMFGYFKITPHDATIAR